MSILRSSLSRAALIAVLAAPTAFVTSVALVVQFGTLPGGAGAIFFTVLYASVVRFLTREWIDDP